MKGRESLIFCLAALAYLVQLSCCQYQPHCEQGREGQVIVHLFSWAWSDIASECENVLGPRGFCGVQVQTFFHD